MTDNYELLRKIKALAEQGFGGEFTPTLQRCLCKLCAKYGIYPNSLTFDRMVDRLFKTKGGEHDRFVSQVISSVVGYRKQYTMGPKTTIVAMTDAEFIEADMKIDFYWADYQEPEETVLGSIRSTTKTFTSSPPQMARNPATTQMRLSVKWRMAESIRTKKLSKKG